MKRIHEYKRQLLNALRIVVLYDRLRDEPAARHGPADVLLRRQGGAGLPAREGHHQVPERPRGDDRRGSRACRDRLKVVFLPDYSVTLAERLIPASDVSNQISTAGYEASGTSNMKFMMNGALTLGTRDGATIEMAEEAGEENFFLFGLTAEQVAGEPRLVQPVVALRARAGDARRARSHLRRTTSARTRPGAFEPIRDALLTHGDYYMHLADLRAYLEASEQLGALYADRDALGAEGDPQRGGVRQVLERPDDRRVRRRHLEREALRRDVAMAAISPLAGKPAPPSVLVNVTRLIHAYYDRHPDPSLPADPERVGGDRQSARSGEMTVPIRVLCVNSGSSSLKLALYEDENRIASCDVEGIGLAEGRLGTRTRPGEWSARSVAGSATRVRPCARRSTDRTPSARTRSVTASSTAAPRTTRQSRSRHASSPSSGRSCRSRRSICRQPSPASTR